MPAYGGSLDLKAQIQSPYLHSSRLQNMRMSALGKDMQRQGHMFSAKGCILLMKLLIREDA